MVSQEIRVPRNELIQWKMRELTTCEQKLIHDPKLRAKKIHRGAEAHF